MKSHRNLFYVALITILLWAGLTGVGRAQDEWLNKPFEQWSKADVQKLLNDSPWARTQEARLDFGSEVRRIAGAPTTSSGHQSTELGGANIAVDYRVTLRLRSALPIRQALVRLKQIEAKYDQMNAKE